MEKGPKPGRGRRRGFDRTKAVDTAMRLFWRHGFEGVSISDLTGTIGIAPPSLYAAFGTKADLFREAIAHYGNRPETRFQPVMRESLSNTARELLERSADAVTSPDGEGGCMVSTGLLACSGDHAGLAAEVAALRERMLAQMAQQMSAWLSPTQASATARYLVTIMQGMAIQARDGVTREHLQGTIELALSGLRHQ